MTPELLQPTIFAVAIGIAVVYSHKIAISYVKTGNEHGRRDEDARYASTRMLCINSYRERRISENARDALRKKGIPCHVISTRAGKVVQIEDDADDLILGNFQLMVCEGDFAQACRILSGKPHFKHQAASHVT